MTRSSGTWTRREIIRASAGAGVMLGIPTLVSSCGSDAPGESIVVTSPIDTAADSGTGVASVGELRPPEWLSSEGGELHVGLVATPGRGRGAGRRHRVDEVAAATEHVVVLHALELGADLDREDPIPDPDIDEAFFPRDQIFYTANGC